jgi:small subunit ribosomal protein S18
MPRPFFVRKKRRGLQRRKVCPFCADKTLAIDWKSPVILKRFITERGKMVPRRISGVCARHQRSLTVAIKRARHIALLPFTTSASP